MEVCLFLAPPETAVDENSRILIRRHIRRFYTQGARRYLFELLPGLPLAFGEETITLRESFPEINVGGIRVAGRDEWESAPFETVRRICWRLDSIYNEYREGPSRMDLTEEWIDLSDVVLSVPCSRRSHPSFRSHIRFAGNIGKQIVILGE